MGAGFTWLLVGNAGIDMQLPLRLAPLTGVYGLSFVFLALAGAATFVLLRRPRRHLLYIVPLAALWLLPAVPPAKPPNAQAVSLQPALRETTPLSEEITTAPCASSPSSRAGGDGPAPAGAATAAVAEAPAPFYYYEDAQFRDQMNTTARLAACP